MNKSIKIDISQVSNLMDSLKNQLTTGEYNLAQRRALNRALNSGKSYASKEIRSIYSMKKSDVDKSIKVIMAIKDPAGKLYVYGTPQPIRYFKPKQKKNGVSIKIGKTRQTIKGAFMQTVRKGTTRQFKSVWLRGRYAGKRFIRSAGRNPITSLTTLSTGAMFANKKAIEPTQTRIIQQYNKRLEHEARYIINKL